MAASNNISPISKASTHGVTDDASKAKLQKAVKDFESLFVGYMLKSMRGTVPKSDMDKDEFGGDMMEGMFDMELSKYISNSSNLGLGEMLYKKLTGEEMPKGAAHQSYLLPSTPVQPAKSRARRRLSTRQSRLHPSKNESQATATRFRLRLRNMG